MIIASLQLSSVYRHAQLIATNVFISYDVAVQRHDYRCLCVRFVTTPGELSVGL
jgi:hypothetical protein